MTEFNKQVMDRMRQFVERNILDITEWCLEDGYDCYDGFASLDQLEAKIRHFEADGWSVNDAYRWLTNMEDFDPRISEDHALEVMAEISKKYK